MATTALLLHDEFTEHSAFRVRAAGISHRIRMRVVTALSITCIVASAALVPTTTRARSSFVPVAASYQQPAVAREAPLTLLSVCGRALCAGNTRFPWRGVTAFGLADLVADGRESEARAFVRWA